MKKLNLSLLVLLITGFTEIFGQTFNILENNVIKSFPVDFRYQGLEIGADFPDLKFIDISGDSVKFEDNKYYVIKFWFVGCTGCKQEEPYLSLLTDEFKDNQKLEFISLCMSKENKIKRYYEKNGKYGYRTISIDRKKVNEYYNIEASPTHFIVYNGKVIENFTFQVILKETLDWYVKRLTNLTAEN